jgi:hypothetical protein
MEEEYDSWGVMLAVWIREGLGMVAAVVRAAPEMAKVRSELSISNDWFFL